MKWPFFLVVVVPLGATEEAEEFAAELEPDPTCTGPHFNVSLSESGDLPVTHKALCSPLTDSMVAALSSGQQRVPDAMFWRFSREGLLVASNVTATPAAGWSVAACFEAAGLSQMRGPSPY
jgi:hypothetical protein